MRRGLQRQQIGSALRRVVFGAFDGRVHRTVATRDEGKRARRRPREGRQQLDAVEHAQAAAGAGAHVDQPAAGAQPRHRGVHRLSQLRRGRLHRSRRLVLVGDERKHQRGGVVAVEPGVLGVRLFGGEKAHFRVTRLLSLNWPQRSAALTASMSAPPRSIWRCAPG